MLKQECNLPCAELHGFALNKAHATHLDGGHEILAVPPRGEAMSGSITSPEFLLVPGLGFRRGQRRIFSRKLLNTMAFAG